jgi:hypothetical protein
MLDTTIKIKYSSKLKEQIKQKSRNLRQLTLAIKKNI